MKYLIVLCCFLCFGINDSAYGQTLIDNLKAYDSFNVKCEFDWEYSWGGLTENAIKSSIESKMKRKGIGTSHDKVTLYVDVITTWSGDLLSFLVQLSIFEKGKGVGGASVITYVFPYHGATYEMSNSSCASEIKKGINIILNEFFKDWDKTH